MTACRRSLPDAMRGVQRLYSWIAGAQRATPGLARMLAQARSIFGAGAARLKASMGRSLARTLCPCPLWSTWSTQPWWPQPVQRLYGTPTRAVQQHCRCIPQLCRCSAHRHPKRAALHTAEYPAHQASCWHAVQLFFTHWHLKHSRPNGRVISLLRFKCSVQSIAQI